MTAKLRSLVEESSEMSPQERLELVREVLSSLPVADRPNDGSPRRPTARVAPVGNVAELAVDFWPAEESADEVVDYIYRQRREDRMEH